MYPVTHVVVEDISATTKEGKRRWNKTFSPLQVGKNYFRDEVEKMGVEYSEYAGYETYGFRNSHGLKKNSNKSKKDFYTHCVDSWVLANEVVGGHTKVDNERVLFLSPLKKVQKATPQTEPSKRRYKTTVRRNSQSGSGKRYFGEASKVRTFARRRNFKRKSQFE